MFRVLQVDPETGVLHINASAVSAHKNAGRLFEVLEDVLRDGTFPVLERMRRLKSSRENAITIEFYLSVLHELRHVYDLLLTPFGFHRIRVAFECYCSIIPAIGLGSFSAFAIPFSSGAEKINRRMLGMDEPTDELGVYFLKLVSYRSKIIAADNSTGFGSDAMLESRAFTLQAELANILFNMKELASRMPYLYRGGCAEWDKKRIESLDKRYRWHWSAVDDLDSSPNPSTSRLLAWITFSSLCGSPSRDTTHQLINDQTFKISDLSQKTLDLTRLPYVRFSKLMLYFKQNGYAKSDDWVVGYKEVNDASEKLFGRTMEQEIEDDISRDRNAVVHIRESVTGADHPDHPVTAFSELIAKREKLLAQLRHSPEIAVSPFQFVLSGDSHRLPRVVFNVPSGTPCANFDLGNCRTILDDRLSFSHRDENGHEAETRCHVAYSFTKSYEPCDHSADSSWDAICESFAPAYKVFLFGRRYRTMCEVEIANPRLLQHLNGFVWDPYYATADDVSESDEWFHFFDIRKARCDFCSNEVGPTCSKLVSGLTIRQNKKFVSDCQSRYSAIFVFHVLVRDWTEWLLCSHCLTTYQFC